MKKRPILITGAAGFIGSHLADAMLARGERVVGVDNFDPFYETSKKQRNIEATRDAAARHGAEYEFYQLDLTDAAATHELFAKTPPAGVLHMAAKAGVRPSIADPVGYALANVVATQIVLSAATGACCSRVVAASSSSVYGNNKKVPFAETDDVSGPISPYAATKRACELVAHTHWALTGLPIGLLRFFTVYGPRQRPDLAISMFLERVGRGEPITLFGDGTSSRDYTYIGDVVAGVLAAYDRIPSRGYRIWNLGGNEPVTLSEVVATVERVVGRAAVVERGPMQPGDVERTFADLTRSGAELDYRPGTAFIEGVARQWAWMQEAGLT